MQQCQPSVSLDSVTYTKVIQYSTRIGCLIHGKLAHAHMIKVSFRPCLFLLNNLLNMYCKRGEMDTACQVFDKMPKRNMVSYNCLISGFAQMGLCSKAIEVFNEARKVGLGLDTFSFTGALSVCGRTGDFLLGKLIHGFTIVSGLGERVFLINALLDMYCKCGQVDQARLLFENFDGVDDISWNTLISGYVRMGANEEMLKLVAKMHRSGLNLNTHSLGSLLKACSMNFSNAKEYGEMLHGSAVKLGLELDVVVGTALLDMYAKTGNPHEAIQIFKLMPNQSVVTCNAMISAFVQKGTDSSDFVSEAFNLFSEMQRRGMKPSKFTFSTILKACIAVEDFECGKQIHAHICKNNLKEDEFLGSALIELYSLSGSIEDGLKCFNSIPVRDVVSWTSMIVGHVHNGRFESALVLFSELLASGRKPDEFTLSSLLSACANLAAPRSGEQIQGLALKIGIGSFTIILNSQLCMYAKSGDIHSAELTFEETQYPDVVSWSVMICSNAQHGNAKETLSLFEFMKGCGIAPNHITFLGVLTACSHGGLVDEGLRYFGSLKNDYGMTANVKHCACVVDLLGRSGRLADAETFILNSGFEDDPVMWRALLSACRVYKDTDTAKRVAERVIELEPQAAASYVLLYNIYNDAGLELPATEVRKLMTDRCVKKEPGLSWIEVGNKVHSFVVGDRSHPMCQTIYLRLEEMMEKIEKLGYVDEKLASCSSESMLKLNSMMKCHSEKLAVTFGIINLPTSAPVRVMKNLRVCHDCHTTMKFFSKVERREIILRDPIRFHHFRDCVCSCRDYW